MPYSYLFCMISMNSLVASSVVMCSYRPAWVNTGAVKNFPDWLNCLHFHLVDIAAMNFSKR